jgi:hypothetical protein
LIDKYFDSTFLEEIKNQKDSRELFKTLEKIITNLEGMYTEEGIKRWFNRPRIQLENKTPKDCFIEKYVEIFDLSRSSSF